MRCGLWQLALLCILLSEPRLGLSQTFEFSPPTPKSGESITVTFIRPYDCTAITPVLEASSANSLTFKSTATDGLVQCPQIPSLCRRRRVFRSAWVCWQLVTMTSLWNFYLRHTADGTTTFLGKISGPLVVAPGSLLISAGFTGNWFNPASSGHGFSIEVLPDNVMLAQWYAFAPEGGQAWISAMGPITGNSAVLQGYFPVGPGGRFPPQFKPGKLSNQFWGTITFVFSDCNSGQASWQSAIDGYGSGWLPITRLTMPAGLSCP